MTDTRSPWTPAEDHHLRSRYHHESTGALARHLGRTRYSVSSRAYALGLRKPHAKNWRPEEDAILRQHYLGRKAKDLLPLLPGRTLVAVHSRAEDLRLRKITLHSWTPETDAAIRAEYPTTLDVRGLAERLGRPYSSLVGRAYELGIHRDPAVKRATLVATWQKRKAAMPPKPPKPARQRAAPRVKTPKPPKPEPTPRPVAVKQARPPKLHIPKRPPCGKEKKRVAQPSAAKQATPWYKHPRGSAEYRAGEAQHFAGKQRHTIQDQYGRQATVYKPIR